MNKARNAILAAVRQSLIHGDQRSIASRDAISERVQSSRVSIQPQINDDLLTMYCEKHEAVHGTFDCLDQSSDIAASLQRYLYAHGLEAELVSGAGPILDTIEWPQSWNIHRRPARKRDRIVISEAFAGIAETGTLVFLRTTGSPTSHLFLAEDHLVILDVANIVKYQEDLWKYLRSRYQDFPKAVNLITGPSKTADIEQTIEYGAHGPRRVHVFLVNLAS